ncbi:unnamed protein product, partial [Iphiclides podalirius]
MLTYMEYPAFKQHSDSGPILNDEYSTYSPGCGVFRCVRGVDGRGGGGGARHTARWRKRPLTNCFGESARRRRRDHIPTNWSRSRLCGKPPPPPAGGALPPRQGPPQLSHTTIQIRPRGMQPPPLCPQRNRYGLGGAARCTR